MNAINYIVAHWVEICAAVSGIVCAARIIVKLTPTPKDDTILESIVEALKHVGLVVKDKAPLLLACLLLSSCVNGQFFGLSSADWLKVGEDAGQAALKSGAQAGVIAYAERRAVTAAKNPQNVTP